MKYAVIDQKGLVVNIIIWDGTPWKPPMDHYVIQHDNVDIGDTYIFEKKEFIKTDRIAK